MHGQRQGGNAQINTCAFYAWEEMRIIYVGKKDAYYAWANPTVGMPTFFPTHFMRGKKCV